MRLLFLVLLFCAHSSLQLNAEDALRDYYQSEKPIWYDSKADSWQRASAQEEAPKEEVTDTQRSEGSGALSDFVIFRTVRCLLQYSLAT